jgi:hypothetical protein
MLETPMKSPIYIRAATAEEAATAADHTKKVDRYGELQRRKKLNEPDEDEAAVLKAEIESWHKDSPADKGPTEKGELYQIQLSPKRNQRTFKDKRKAFNVLMRTLGRDGLIAVIEIPFGVLDKSVPASAQAAFMTEERSGYRTLTVVALQPAELKVAA